MSNTILACAQWEWQNPWPQGNNLNDILMISPDTIWAAGEGGVLLHSTNGGTNWSVDYSDDGWHLYKLFFTSSETGFVSGTGQIYKTINGGTDWYSSYHSGYDEIRDIQFINDSIGWACGEDGMMLSTENGGIQWNESPLAYSQTIRSICYMNDKIGWATGYNDDPWFFQGNGIILKTLNGGQDWISLYEDEYTFFYDILFTDSVNGIALGYSDKWDHGIILHSNDGGVIWDSTYSAYGYFYEAHFTGIDTGWVIGREHHSSGSTFYKTTDGGISWTKIADIEDAELYSFDETPEGEFMAIGKSGKITESTDGGIFWTTISRGLTLEIHDLEMLDEYTGWAVGEKGIILHTNDGGLNWNEQYSGTLTDLESVSLLDELTAFTVGEYDILKTTNGGETWDIIHQCSKKMNSVFVINENIVWTVGWQGFVLKTQNGGNTWVDKSINENHRLNDIFFYNSAIGWIVGELANGNGTGIILKTHDYGNNWTSQADSLLFSPLYSVDFINYNEGWAAGWFDFILHTSDGGNSWEVQRSFKDNSSLYTFGLVDISFSDQNNGWAVGYGSGPHSRMYITNDGGIEWNEVKQPAFNALYSVNFINNNQGWIAGQNGAILYTDNGGQTWTGQQAIENEESIKVFPNPASSDLSIHSTNADTEYEIIIFSSSGKKVYQGIIPKGGESRINISKLKPGVYILVMNNEEGVTERGKFIKY